MDNEKMAQTAQDAQSVIDSLAVINPVSEKKEEKDADILQFKISLISPVIYHTHTYRSDRAYLETVSCRTLQLPDGRFYAGT